MSPPTRRSLLLAALAVCHMCMARGAAHRRSLHQAAAGGSPLGAAADVANTSGPSCGVPGGCPWLDGSLPWAQRLEQLLAALTPEQKKAQLSTDALEGVPDLGIRPFSWQSECLHGAKMGQAGTVGEPGSGYGTTIYPQNLAMAATFDDNLIETMAGQISDEMRALANIVLTGGIACALHDCSQPPGDVPSYTAGLSPHVTLIRDSRWGRLSEAFSEDPLLSGRMGAATVRGLQGGDERLLKVAAIVKHFLGHDFDRTAGTSVQNFDARYDPADLRDSFLPPFQACVAAGAQGAMCSFNAVDGLPACANPELLDDTLRGQLGFNGTVLTDNRALETMTKPTPQGLGFAGSDARAAAAAVLEGGTDLFFKTSEDLEIQDVSEERLDEAVTRVLRGRLRMGHLDPPASSPWAALNATTLGLPAHAATARQIMLEGAVLLKNSGALPLSVASLSSLAVIGPFAANETYVMGRNYGATAGPVVTPLAALRAALPGVAVTFDNATAYRYTEDNVRADSERCEAADACILFLGTRIPRLAPSFWEELPDNAYDQLFEGEGRDRLTLLLEPNQDKMWKELAAATSKPLVVVLVHGGPLDLSDMEASDRVGAILTAWLPGQHGAAALADLLLGREAPSGRLPLSWYRESYVDQLDITDLRMRADGDYPGRTYRYWQGEAPLYAFGHGLSYSNFTFSAAAAAPTPGGAAINVTVTHGGGPGAPPASTAVLLFLRYLGPSGDDQAGEPAAAAMLPASGCTPDEDSTSLVQRLAAYARTDRLQPGQTQGLAFQLALGPDPFRSSWGGFGDPQPPCGLYGLRFGADQPDLLTLELQP